MGKCFEDYKLAVCVISFLSLRNKKVCKSIIMTYAYSEEIYARNFCHMMLDTLASLHSSMKLNLPDNWKPFKFCT